MTPAIEFDSDISDVNLFNMEAGDSQLHGNALFVYLDRDESPMCTAVAIGHLLWYTSRGAVPFDDGNLVTTMPFRVETSRLGKRVDEIAYHDLASLKAKYKLPQETRLTMLLRRRVAGKTDELLERDVEQYCEAYCRRRSAEIDSAYQAAETQARQLKVQPDRPAPLLFGLSALPAPTESAVLSADIAGDSGPRSIAFAILWHLVRRPEYARALEQSSGGGSIGNRHLDIRLHHRSDGSWCLGLERRNPLAVLGDAPEIAHFHRVALNETEAKRLGSELSQSIAGQFRLDAHVIAAPRGKRTR
jgi:hypothetical protein